MEKWTFQRMNDLIFLWCYFGQQLFPCAAVHTRHIDKQLALQHFHHVHHASCVMEIYHSIRAAWHYGVDAVNFVGISFKILQRQFYSQFISIRKKVKYRICGSCHCHIKHDSIEQDFFCNQI